MFIASVLAFVAGILLPQRAIRAEQITIEPIDLRIVDTDQPFTLGAAILDFKAQPDGTALIADEILAVLGRHFTLTPDPRLTLVGTFAEASPPVHFEPLPTAAAEGTLTPVLPPDRTPQRPTRAFLLLGLALLLVAGVAGFVWIRSEPGRGSQFWFTVRAPRAQRNSDAAPLLPVVLRGARVLCAVDPTTFESLGSLLRGMGLRAGRAESGAQALRLLRQERRRLAGLRWWLALRGDRL